MTVSDLSKAEGAEHVANRAGITFSALAKLRSGHVTKSLLLLADFVVGLTDTYEGLEDDVSRLLLQLAAGGAGSDLRALAKLAEAWPQLDITAAVREIAAKRDRRAAKKDAGYVETRGRGVE